MENSFENDKSPFKPPAAFIQASMARQARIRQMQQERDGAALNAKESSRPSSPVSFSNPVSFPLNHPIRPSKQEGVLPHASSRGRAKHSIGSPKKRQFLGTKVPHMRPKHLAPLEKAPSFSSDTDSSSFSGEVTSSLQNKNQNTPSKQRDANLTTASSSSRTTPSKAVLEVERLRRNREERRQRQNELRKQRDALDDIDQKTIYYRQVIDSFREEFLKKRKELHLRIKSSESLVKLKDGSEKPVSSRRQQPRIKVCVRKRPMNAKEVSDRHFDAITTATESFPYAYIYLHDPKVRVDMSQEVQTHRFIFDHVFDETATNADVYESTVRPLVNAFFQGTSVNLFAYGQTGSGKSHTIFGERMNGMEQRIAGVYEYLCQDLLVLLQSHNSASLGKQRSKQGETPDFYPSLHLYISFYELYRGKAYDLLANRTRVQLLEDAKGNIQLHGHTEVQVQSLEDMLKVVDIGLSTRSTGSTGANAHSSRSHAIIQLILRRDHELTTTKTARVNESFLNPHQQTMPKPFGKFLLIDLAGSERGEERAHVDRETRLEGAEINKSLLALKECIRALYKRTPSPKQERVLSHSLDHQGQEKQHIPFRGSKLTQLLKESLIGRKTQTVMMAMLSPSSHSTDHTLNTLRYADRMKELRRLESTTTVVTNNDTGKKIDNENRKGSMIVISPSEEHVVTPEFDVQLLEEEEEELDEHSAMDEMTELVDENEYEDTSMDKEEEAEEEDMDQEMSAEVVDLQDSSSRVQEGKSQSVTRLMSPLPIRAGLKRTSRPSTSSSFKTDQSQISSQEDILSFHYDLIPHSAKLATLERDLLRSLEEDTSESNMKDYIQGMWQIAQQRLEMWSTFKERLEVFAETVGCDFVPNEDTSSSSSHADAHDGEVT